MNSLLARKVEQNQAFLENGTRIPVTRLAVSGNTVTAIKTIEKDQHNAIQLGFEKRSKKLSKKSNKSIFYFLKEVDIKESDAMPKIGDVIKASEVFKPGDVVNIIGISKGKGYAGAVKKHHFKGGPRTHGQSDRERAPGAVGSTTTPGRVYRGKRMAGKMGFEKTTVKNLKIITANDDFVLIKGLVPGGRNNLLVIEKTGEDKKFVPLYVEKVEVKTEVKAKVKPEEPKIAEESKSEIKKEEAKTEEVKK